jgi:hypothetical protein
MRIVDRDGILFVRDSPGFHWLLGLLFLSVGALFVLGPLGLFHDRTTVGWPLRALSALLGGTGVVAGLWMLHRSPQSTLEVDRRSDRVRLRRRGAGGRPTWVWSIRDVEEIRLAETRDDEDRPVFRVLVVLRDGDVVPVSLLWIQGGEAAEAVVTRLREALGMRAT